MTIKYLTDPKLKTRHAYYIFNLTTAVNISWTGYPTQNLIYVFKIIYLLIYYIELHWIFMQYFKFIFQINFSNVANVNV